MKCATSQRTLLQENIAQDHVDVCFGETTQRLSKSREETPLVKSDSFYFVFFSNENGTDNMTEKHRGGGAGRGCLNIIQQVNTVWWGLGGRGKQEYQME